MLGGPGHGLLFDCTGTDEDAALLLDFLRDLFNENLKELDERTTVGKKLKIVCMKEEEAAFQGSCCILYTTQTVVFGLQYKVYILLRN